MALPASTPTRTPDVVVTLWEGNPPGYVADAGDETTFPQWPETVGNVSIPTLAVYLPPKESANGFAVLYCSGGSYNKVSKIADDVGDADFFLSRGVALIVLKYRTTPPGARDHSDALQDLKRAMRLVRHRAQAWRIDRQKIGVLGGSAGAHLTLTLATHSDDGQPAASDPIEREGCRPAFIALLCPWPWNQTVSDFAVNKATPPAFICSARDDDVAPTAFAEGIAASYKEAGVLVELWLINQGGHAAFNAGGPGVGWKERFWTWLDSLARH